MMCAFFVNKNIPVSGYQYHSKHIEYKMEIMNIYKEQQRIKENTVLFPLSNFVKYNTKIVSLNL